MNTSVKSPAKPSKAKPIFIAIGAVLLGGALLFGWGFTQGRSQLSEQKTRFDAQIQDVRTQLGQSQSDLTQSRRETEEAKNLSRVMQARGELYRSAVDLEQRNFGTANTHLRQSAALLGEVGSSANLDAARVNSVRDALAKTNIAVASDLGAQRAQILALATQLDALAPAPPSVSSAPASAANAPSALASPPAQNAPPSAAAMPTENAAPAPSAASAADSALPSDSAPPVQ